MFKLEAYTNEEIASNLGPVTRSVERKLRVICNLRDRDFELK
jgi:hypothetical protein